MKLWDISHSYYSSDTNYYVNGLDNWGRVNYKSWAAFYEEMGDADLDHNYLVRWDWQTVDPDDFAEEEMPGWTDRLRLFYVQQRRGNYVPIIVDVNRDDEPAIRAFLQRHRDYVHGLWDF